MSGFPFILSFELLTKPKTLVPFNIEAYGGRGVSQRYGFLRAENRGLTQVHSGRDV